MAKLVTPSAEYKEAFLESLKEFHEKDGNSDRELLDLSYATSHFDELIATYENNAKGVGLKEGFVPSTTLWLVDDTVFIGRISIRHHINNRLLVVGGHIGYEIRPSMRKKGYGTLILTLALPIAKGLGINRVLITCDDANIGSAKIIEKNGGILENIIEDQGILKRRYWITL